MVKIDKKIIKQEVLGGSKEPLLPPKTQRPVNRPLCLSGKTYKLHSHVYEHSFYVTINFKDNVPFEIFINTRNEDCIMWLASQTLSWSAIFREGLDLIFLINGMLKVVDPKGAHQAHERFHKSIVAEIGYILDCEINGIALRKSERPDKVGGVPLKSLQRPQVDASPILGNECPKCGQRTFVKRDGCDMCLNEECEYSSCS